MLERFKRWSEEKRQKTVKNRSIEEEDESRFYTRPHTAAFVAPQFLISSKHHEIPFADFLRFYFLLASIEQYMRLIALTTNKRKRVWNFARFVLFWQKSQFATLWSWKILRRKLFSCSLAHFTHVCAVNSVHFCSRSQTTSRWIWEIDGVDRFFLERTKNKLNLRWWGKWRHEESTNCYPQQKISYLECVRT